MKLVFNLLRAIIGSQLAVINPVSIVKSEMNKIINPIAKVSKLLGGSRREQDDDRHVARLERNYEIIQRARARKEAFEIKQVLKAREKNRKMIESWRKLTKRINPRVKINRFSTESRGMWTYTGFIKAPGSWLNSMIFNKFSKLALIRPKRGKAFYTEMHTDIFDRMSRSQSPGTVLWNTAWLHKRVWYKKGNRIGKRRLRINAKTRQFNLTHGVRKYQQINRKW